MLARAEGVPVRMTSGTYACAAALRMRGAGWRPLASAGRHLVRRDVYALRTTLVTQ